MIRREIVCDICGGVIPKGDPAFAFEFAAGPRLPGDRDRFDFTFSAPQSMERHWCSDCLIGVAKMAPEARQTLKTISGR